MKIGKFELDKIYCGDCKDLTKGLPNNSIDMCITSPPYWGLRDYGIEGIIWDGDENCEHEWQTNSEVKEMFKDSGSGWLIGHEKGKKEAKVISRNEHPEYWEKKEIKTNFCSKCGAWKGQLGLEPDFNLYIKHLCDIFDEVKRVLKKEGTCWVNIGDSYFGSGKGAGGDIDNSKEVWTWTQKTKKICQNCGKEFMGWAFQNFCGGPCAGVDNTKREDKGMLQNKCLCLIPFRFAIEMVNRGWILRNVIIWHKPNCMPSSAKDRFTVDFEYLFFFVKSSTTQYWINFKTYQIVDKQPKGTQGIEGIDWEWKEHLTCKGKGCDNKRCINGKTKNSFWEGKDYYFEQQFESWTDKNKHDIERAIYGHKEYKGKYKLEKKGSFSMSKSSVVGNPMIGRNKRTVWSITTKGFKEAHFAVFPEELIETPIKAGCPEFVCVKCGQAREKIYKIIKHQLKEDYRGQAHKDYASAKAQNPSNTKRRILKSMSKEQKEVGYTNCACNVGFEGGIVLDPFIGSGTTGLVALKQRKHFIGFEISPKYVEIANRGLENVQVSML